MFLHWSYLKKGKDQKNGVIWYICLYLLIWDCGSDVSLESAPFRRNNCLKVKMRPMLSRCAPVMVLVKQCLQCHWHQILSKTRDATSVLLYLSRIKKLAPTCHQQFHNFFGGISAFFFKRFVLMPLQSPWVYFCNLWCFQVSLDPIRKSKEESCRWSLVIVWRRIFSVTNDSWSWNHFFVPFVTYPFYIPFILYIYILLWSHSDGCTTKNVFAQAMSLAWNSIATDVASLGELPAMPLPPPLWRVPKSQERSRCFFLENDVKKHGKFRNHHLKDYCSWQFVCFWTSDISQADNWYPYPNSRAILEVEDNKTLINRTGNDAKAQHENTTGDTSPLSSN